MKRVLIVDDDIDILDVLKVVLKFHGFEVITTQSGNNVISESISFSPDLILLDVFLSGIDGRDICNTLKENPETKKIPVIMFSAHSNKNEILQYCNADDFIAKPFDINDLVGKINGLIGLN